MKATPRKLIRAGLVGTALGCVLAGAWIQFQRGRERAAGTPCLLPEPRQLYTTRHLVQSGHKAVSTYLEADSEVRGPAVMAMLEQRYPVCVRIENRHAFTKEGGFSSSSGSGVIVGDGRFVLTAGHLFGPDMPASQPRAVLTSGELIDLDLQHLEHDTARELDLAVLRISAGPIPVPPIELAEAHVGQTVFVVGYIDSFGISATGDFRESVITPAKGNCLRPLVQIGNVKSVSSRIAITPTVGCTALLGLSGAPVLDESGRLVGVFTCLSRRRHPDGTGEAEYTMMATAAISGRQRSVASLLDEQHPEPAGANPPQTPTGGSPSQPGDKEGLAK